MKTDPHFIPDAPERPQRPRGQWSLGSMCLLALVVCGLAWLAKFTGGSDALMVYPILAGTAGAALFGLYRGNVLLYAGWTFVILLCVFGFIGGLVTGSPNEAGDDSDSPTPAQNAAITFGLLAIVAVPLIAWMVIKPFD